MHVLGIDAGGTKTVCLLADQTGAILSEGRGGGANLQASGELEVEKVLHEVMERALGDRDEIRPSAICLGIAGVDRQRDADAIRGIMRRIGFKSRVLVVNDALIALTAGVGDESGLVVIAGTGSIAYGRKGHRAARSGGWGYLLGDEGGGFWIGRAALSAVVRQFDGRGPSTQLTDLVLRNMHLHSPTELIHAIYDRGLQRHAVAGIAAVVREASAAGDAVATEILGRAATELGAAASAVVQTLGMRGSVFRTVLAGGIFRAIPTLADAVTLRLSEIAPRTSVELLQIEPATGAVHLALAAARGEAAIPHYL
jgi:N-acetylglucosamine kinase